MDHLLDKTKTHYKITNKTEKHNKLQYHDGLVIDLEKFDGNPTHSCVKGGIYFTTKKHIHLFFEHGVWIRPVTIPTDARVILDPEGDKYRADKLYFHPRKGMEFYFNNLFNKKTFPKEDYWYLAISCSKHFDKWFDKKTFPKKDYQWDYRWLAKYCSKHFDKWFDKKTFPKKDYQWLAKYCSKHFDKWFDKETFPKENYWYLAKYCSKHFDKWFDVFKRDNFI